MNISFEGFEKPWKEKTILLSRNMSCCSIWTFYSTMPWSKLQIKTILWSTFQIDMI
jgi:hypothetical protein